MSKASEMFVPMTAGVFELLLWGIGYTVLGTNELIQTIST